MGIKQEERIYLSGQTEMYDDILRRLGIEGDNESDKFRSLIEFLKARDAKKVKHMMLKHIRDTFGLFEQPRKRPTRAHSSTEGNDKAVNTPSKTLPRRKR